MLNIFPILFLAPIGFFILRLFIGMTLLYLGFKHVRVRNDLKYSLTQFYFFRGLTGIWLLISIEIIIAALFILGLYTQIAALAGMLLACKMVRLRKKVGSPYIPQPLFYILLFGASFTLLITGAGAFAFDLPF